MVVRVTVLKKFAHASDWSKAEHLHSSVATPARTRLTGRGVATERAAVYALAAVLGNVIGYIASTHSSPRFVPRGAEVKQTSRL